MSDQPIMVVLHSDTSKEVENAIRSMTDDCVEILRSESVVEIGRIDRFNFIESPFLPELKMPIMRRRENSRPYLKKKKGRS